MIDFNTAYLYQNKIKILYYIDLENRNKSFILNFENKELIGEELFNIFFGDYSYEMDSHYGRATCS